LCIDKRQIHYEGSTAREKKFRLNKKTWENRKARKGEEQRRASHHGQRKTGTLQGAKLGEKIPIKNKLGENGSRMRVQNLETRGLPGEVGAILPVSGMPTTGGLSTPCGFSGVGVVRPGGKGKTALAAMSGPD